MPGGAEKGGKGKKAAILPPKPAIFTEEAWLLAHNVTRLLELLSAADKGSSAKEKPPASKQTAALWLWQLLGSDADAREEACKAKAAEAIAKLLVTPGTDGSLSISLQGCLVCLATPASDAQAVAVCEALMAAKPPLVPWLLKQLETSPGAGTTAAAALGVLHALLACSETRPLVAKVISSWNQHPLIAALTAHQLLPLMGGRNASAHAARIIEILCSPPPPEAAVAGGGAPSAGGKDSAKGSKPARTASASSKASGSSGGAAGGGTGAGCDASLTAMLQTGVLMAGGVPALLKVCTATGSTAPCRSSAVTALCHILAAHGHETAVKRELQAVNGLATLVQVMGRTALPLAARAAAAGCVYYYLAPQPAAAVGSTGAQTALQSTESALLRSTSSATQPIASLPASRPGTSQSVSKSIIRNALQQRRQQATDASADHSAASITNSRPTTGGGTQRGSSGGGVNGTLSSRRSMTGDGAGRTRPSTATAPAADLQLPPAPGDAAAAAVAAQHAALLAQWDEPARKGLAACAEEVVAAGALPALLVLCCGMEGPPPGLEAAAAAAAAAAALKNGSSTQTISSSNIPNTAANAELEAPTAYNQNNAGNTAADSKGLTTFARRSAGSTAGGAAAETLDSIAEPPQAADGEDDGQVSASAHTSADSSRLDSADSNAHKKNGKKGSKKSKKPVKLDPSMIEAQTRASAAIKLLALAGDAPRAALLSAGALPVLLPLLDGGVAAARWNARQALLSLSLVAALHTCAAANSSSNSGSTTAATQAASCSVKLPAYISLLNMPESHWQLVAPPSMPPQPPLPVIPGRTRADGGVAAPGSAGGTSGRPGSQGSPGRRASVCNAPPAQPQASQASRMSTTSSFMDGQAGPTASAGGGVRGAKGPRASMTMAATAAAAAAALQVAPTAAVQRTSSTAAAMMAAAGHGMSNQQHAVAASDGP